MCKISALGDRLQEKKPTVLESDLFPEWTFSIFEINIFPKVNAVPPYLTQLMGCCLF